MPHTKITQAYVDGLPFQDSGTLWVHDAELAGFNLSIGQRTKTYYAAGEHGNRFIRVKIGRADVTKANEARAVARDVLLPEIRRGVDPRAKQLSDDDQAYARILAGIREARPEDLSDQMARRIIRGKAKRRADELTVGQVWAMYEEYKRASILEEQGPEKARRAETHITQQRRYLGGAETYGKDGPYASSLEWPKGWWDRPITDITPELCSTTWRNLNRTRGRRTAQMFFMAVQVLFNYAVAKKEVPVTSHPMVIDAAGDGIGLPKGRQFVEKDAPRPAGQIAGAQGIRAAHGGVVQGDEFVPGRCVNEEQRAVVGRPRGQGVLAGGEDLCLLAGFDRPGVGVGEPEVGIGVRVFHLRSFQRAGGTRLMASSRRVKPSVWASRDRVRCSFPIITVTMAGSSWPNTEKAKERLS